METNPKKLSHLLKARFPFIYIATYEEERATKYIKSIVTNKTQIKYTREVFIWTQATGLKIGNDSILNTTNPNRLIEYIEKQYPVSLVPDIENNDLYIAFCSCVPSVPIDP